MVETHLGPNCKELSSFLWELV